MRFPGIIFICGCLFTACQSKKIDVTTSSMRATLEPGTKTRVTKSDTFYRNDIAVFDYYGEDYTSDPASEGLRKSWQKWVFRMVAFSGDKVELKNGDLFINDRKADVASTVLNQYKVASTELLELPDNKLEDDFRVVGRDSGLYRYQCAFTAAEAEEYRQRKPAIVSVTRLLDPELPALAFYCKDCQHSVDNWGPFIIPWPGDTVIVDNLEQSAFRNIPGVHNGKNLVKEKLYFVLGDNRHGAMDSRFIGLITASKMYGIVEMKR